MGPVAQGSGSPRWRPAGRRWAGILLALTTLGAAIGCTDSAPRQLLVAVNGPSSGADGSSGAPFPDLGAAVRVARPGDEIRIGPGRFPIPGTVRITTPGVRITGDPGGGTVFDGSQLIDPSRAVRVGANAAVPYQPLAAQPGQGLGLADLPLAESRHGQLTAAARQAGWHCVSGPDSYSQPKPTATDPVGCPGRTARRTSGYFPDQAWVGDRPLQQVLDPERVGPGRFYVPRSQVHDAAPPTATMLISASDLEAGALRVGATTGNFLVIAADGVSLASITVVRHSPAWSATTVTIEPGVAGTRITDLTLTDNAGVSLKAAGAWRGGGELVTDTQLTRVRIAQPGWMAATIGYTDDTLISDSQFRGADPFEEFTDAPVRGAIKAAKNHRMVIAGSTFADNSGHGLWLDQSNYEITIADSVFTGNADAGVFFEISHGLDLVNSLILGGDRDAAVRLAGSSGLRLVNNTIVGGTSPVAILTDARSRSYPRDGRPCSEHPARYGGPDWDLATCAVAYPSDFDRTRSGAYGPGPNQTPGMDWRPVVELMINNVLAGSRGIRYCGIRTLLCVRGATRWTGELTEVPLESIFHPGTVLDGNIYQATGAALIRVAGRPRTLGNFSAHDLATLRGVAGFGGDPYNLAVEEHGRAGTDLVSDRGCLLPALISQGPVGASVPADPAINRHLPAGWRNYGARPKSGACL